MRFVIFFSIVVAVLVGGHYYVWRRITVEMDEPIKRRLRYAIAALPLTVLIVFGSRIAGTEAPWLDALSWLGWCALGFSSLLLTLVVLRDLIWVVTQLAMSATEKHLSQERRKVIFSSLGFGKLGASGVLLGYGRVTAIRPSLIPRA